MDFKEYKVEGDCVVGPDGALVYDDINPRAGEIIAQLLTYRSILEAERSWRPMETAPKDGTHVVLFGTLQNDPNLTPRACVSWYCRDRKDSPAYCLGWFFSAPGYSNGFNPTHWTPLPASPTTHEGDPR